MHVQGDAETFLAVAAHIIGIYSWTTQHVPDGADGTTLARAFLDGHSKARSETQKDMARNKHMEQRLSRSDGNVDGGSGRSATSMNMQSTTMIFIKDEGCVVRTQDTECEQVWNVQTCRSSTPHFWPFATGNMPLSDCLTPHFTLSSTLGIFVVIFLFFFFKKFSTILEHVVVFVTLFFFFVKDKSESNYMFEHCFFKCEHQKKIDFSMF